MEKSRKINSMSSEAVQKATGKGWDEWLAILDKQGAAGMAHKEIAELLYEKHSVPGWWAQMITVGYEQKRGMRKEHERPDGFEISRSKTIDVPVARLFKALADDRARTKWLQNGAFKITKSTQNKSIRAAADGKTRLSIEFYSKGATKSQIVVQHSKLTSAVHAEKKKKYWAGKLDDLKAILEKSA